MFKKMSAAILAFILLLGMIVPASALETSNNVTDIYVLTDPVPSEVYSHVQTSIAGMISDLYDLSKVKVGTPFKVYGSSYDLYYFVIYYNDKAVGTYRVFETENGFTGIFTENAEFIDELRNIPLLSRNSPVKITAGNNDDLYAVVDSKIYSIYSDPEGKVTPSSELLKKANEGRSASIVNIAESISFILPEMNTRTNPTYNFLQIGYPEKQTDEKWCMAFCTASIIRYKTGASVSTINAESVMRWQYGDVEEIPLDELKKKSFTTTMADNYANTYGINPTYTGSSRSYSQITAEINADSPVVFVCSLGDGGATHAIVCRGYNDNSGNPFYSIWNPWKQAYERIYASDNYYIYVSTSGNKVLLWVGTMYGWD